MAKTRWVSAIAAVLALTTVAASSQTLPVPDAWGPTDSGLRLGLSLVHSGKQRAAEVELSIALQNVGESDFILNLGSMLGDGSMAPRAIHLVLSDAAGRTRDLDFFDRRHGIVAGRVDSFVVALRAGSTYVLRVRLDDYWNVAYGDPPLYFAPGTYQVAARFEGKTASNVNLDMGGIALMKFWTGAARSNSVALEISTSEAPK